MRKLTVPGPRYGLRPPEVVVAFGSRVLYEEALRAGLLKPRINRRKLVVYDASDVAQCWARIVSGELPGAEN